MRNEKTAFTLVELLVVIAIIGILVALLLPAIQSAREAARRTQCKSQLRNLALASQNHHDVHKFFPSGGWGWEWVGDKDLGFGASQPGGWIFSLLPYIEEANGYHLAGDGNASNISRDQKRGAANLIENPITIINCPSRRPPQPYPLDRGGRPPVNMFQTEVGGKTDYAANSGDQPFNYGTQGPADLTDAANFSQWCTSGVLGQAVSTCPHFSSNRLISPLTGIKEYSGVSFERSEVGIQHITDGSSNTYLIGEKYLNSTQYEVATASENETWCSGFNNDNFRTAYYPPHQDAPTRLEVEQGYDPPLAAINRNEEHRFGSAHAAGFHAAYCDGSVTLIQYDVDLAVHRASGNRADGTVAGN